MIAKGETAKSGAIPLSAGGATRLPRFSESWRRVRIGDICDFLRTGVASRADLSANAGVGYIHYGDIHASVASTWDLRRHNLPEILAAKVARLPRLRDGDIVMADASEDYEGIGKAVEVCGIGNRDVVAGLHTILMRGRENQLALGFGGYLQFLPEVRRGIVRIANGISVYGISPKGIAAIEISLPSLDEQRAIAEALGDVDALIGALDTLIAKKRDVKRGAMQRLLTGATRLPAFSKAWERVALGARGHFTKGQGISRAQVQGHGLPCVRYGEIYTHHNDQVRAFHSFISTEVAATSTRLSHGDLLFTASGETAEEIGKCVAFLRSEEAYVGGDIVIFRPSADDPAFLGYLMNHETVVRQKIRRAQGDMVVHISARALSAIEFDAPPIEEQRAIATILADIDAEIEALEARRAKTANLKKGMMRDLLTGRVRLTGTGEKRAMEAAE